MMGPRWRPEPSLFPKLAGGLYLDEIIGKKAALLEREEIFERSPQPLLIFVGVQQDRHSIMERPYRFVAVSHRPRIDRPPFGAFPPQPAPGEDRLPLHGDPCPGLKTLGPCGLGKAGQRDETAALRLCASPLHMGFDRSAMLLTGLGFESGFMPFRRSGKPHTMDSSTRSPSASRITMPG